MNDQTLMERVITLEHQVLTLSDTLFAIAEVLIDQGISSKADIKSRYENIRKDRER